MDHKFFISNRSDGLVENPYSSLVKNKVVFFYLIFKKWIARSISCLKFLIYLLCNQRSNKAFNQVTIEFFNIKNNENISMKILISSWRKLLELYVLNNLSKPTHRTLMAIMRVLGGSNLWAHIRQSCCHIVTFRKWPPLK